MLDGLVHVKGKEIAMDNGLELVTGRVVQLNVNGSEQAIQLWLGLVENSPRHNFSNA